MIGNGFFYVEHHEAGFKVENFHWNFHVLGSVLTYIYVVNLLTFTLCGVDL